ncbi:hypothetical protein CK203_114228 [Vitis vinifera]|uniref:Uncharacterized protein n=1 Tax=Vitis vinifera TaxID=29760 RepID=A0A438CA63_VITVI|nr:hypothetical protein CK203_114228 [Vitis vinifera]
MERMDHFQLQQDQQTLILREIQQHLDLVPLAPPVEMLPQFQQRTPPIQQRTPPIQQRSLLLIIRSLLSFFSPLLSGGITSSLLLSLAFGTLGTMFILVGGRVEEVIC